MHLLYIILPITLRVRDAWKIIWAFFPVEIWSFRPPVFAVMSGQPSGNTGVATSRPTTNGNSNGGMSMVSQQRSNDSSAGPSTASVAQNGSMSQANLNNIVRPIISLWPYMWNSHVCYVVVKNYLLWSTQAFFFHEFFIIYLQTLHLCGCHIMNKQGSWFPHTMTLTPIEIMVVMAALSLSLLHTIFADWCGFTFGERLVHPR